MKEQVRAGFRIAFILFFVVPTIFTTLGFLTRVPNGGTNQGINVFGSIAIPWWTGIAIGLPVLFVILVAVLVLVDADEIL